MVRIEVQHFHGCPNSNAMIKRVREAITKSKVETEYREVLVYTPEKAAEFKFRGSPTVLVDGIDLEGLAEPEYANLSCRYYKNGIPSVETILNTIANSAYKER